MQPMQGDRTPGGNGARVLITGSRGYLGRLMSHHLHHRGHRITGLDTGYFSSETIGHTDDVRPAELKPVELKKDVRDVTVDDLRGFDTVIHLAALAGASINQLNPEWTEQINVEGSLHLAYVARQAGVSRFLFASSCEVYGAAGHEKVAEYTLTDPATLYAVSKVKCEEGLDRLASYDFSPVYMRCARVYGWTPNMRLDSGLNRMVAQAVRTSEIPLANPNHWTALVHVEDVARAFAAVLEAKRESIHNESFNIGAESENYQRRELATFIAQQVPGARLVEEAAAIDNPASYRVQFHKIRRMVPAFEPQWTVQQGISEMRVKLGESALPQTDLADPRLARLAHLKHLLKLGALDERLRWTASEVAA